MSTKLNVHIYPTPFKFESRILKETASIIRLGLAEEVIILAVGERGQRRSEQIDNSVKVERLVSWFSSLPQVRLVVAIKYIEFYIRVLLWVFFKKRISIINCHSLMVLPLGVFTKFFRKRITLIYDAHELETERNGLGNISKKFSKFLERSFIKRCDSVIVVGHRIKDWYTNAYGLQNIFVVRNTPRKTSKAVKSDLLRHRFRIGEGGLLFIYQGMLIPGRGLKILVDAFKTLGTGYDLIVMGYGEFEPWIRKTAEENTNIHFHEAVAPREIMEYTSSCDIGISLIENTSLSYYFSLPNKVFEYLHAGLPVIVSSFPEMKRIVEDYSVGWAVDPTAENLVNLIRKMTENDIARAKAHVVTATEILNWENEEAELKKAFTASTPPQASA